jgi:hypothetical protein
MILGVFGSTLTHLVNSLYLIFQYDLVFVGDLILDFNTKFIFSWLGIITK